MILINDKMITMLKKQAVGNLRLNRKLTRILEAGIKYENGCYFLSFFHQENLQYSLADFEDHTAYECFINGFHIEDYCAKNNLIYAFAFARKLAKKLRNHCQFKIIISATSLYCCHVTFHTFHKNETEWVNWEQLDSYPECLAILT